MVGGDIIRADQSIMSATFSTMSAVGQLPDIAKAASAQGFIFGIIDRQSSIDTLASLDADGSNSAAVAAKPAGECGLELRGVSFSYPSAKDTLALVSVNLAIRGGESTALVGGSGSGKSTVLRLLQRLYDPSLGGVFLDGRDVRGMDPAWLRRQLAVVGQEPVLYNASILENVKYGGPLDPETGEPTATDDEVVAACEPTPTASSRGAAAGLPDAGRSSAPEAPSPAGGSSASPPPGPSSASPPCTCWTGRRPRRTRSRSRS